MKKRTSLALLSFAVCISTFGEITFDVENLSKPSSILPTIPYDASFRKLIQSDVENNFHAKTDSPIPYNIVAHSAGSGRLVCSGQHAFFEGMYNAFNNHRPFVLSPDMVWLLISQGFAQHVVNNAEALRHYFVKHDGKITLIVRNDQIVLSDSTSPWDRVFPEFTKQINEAVGKDLVGCLTCDFTTSTHTTQVASQITIMEAMKKYFEFKVQSMACGIPQITLEGTPEDWQKIVTKARQLKQYELGWWMDEILPVLEEMAKASSGNIDKKFWQSMFIRSRGKDGAGCGRAQSIDGWIVKFFPYNKDGKRNNLQELTGSGKLPKELVKVDLEYQNINPLSGKVIEKVPLEIWAGFIGLKQTDSTFALRPEIGWMVRKKDLKDAALVSSIEDAKALGADVISIRVSKIPKEILEISPLSSLHIVFTDKIIVPAEMGKMSIDYLSLTGKIDDPEIENLMKLLTNTRQLTINGNRYK
jgi:hypothetical protein